MEVGNDAYGWSDETRSVLTISAIAIGTFLLVFIAIVFRISNEILIARRCILWARLAVLGSVICQAIQLHLELHYERRLISPHFGAVRPIVGVILMFLAFFVSSHQVFRWLVVVAQPLYIVSDFYTASELRIEINCRMENRCLKPSGITFDDLKLLEGANLAAAFWQIWLIFIAAYLLICMGACHNRYPVRLFSITKPLSAVPASAKRSTPMDMEGMAYDGVNGDDGVIDVRDALGNVVTKHKVHR